jgi:hypothetical protein
MSEDARQRSSSIVRHSAGLLAASLLLASCSGATTPEKLRAEARDNWPLIEHYCYECHDSIEQTAGLALDKLGPDSIAEHADVWEKVVRKLRGRMMPPPGGARPDNADVDRVVAWLEASLDQGAPATRAGRPALHRLNRTEYANSIRDLLALEVDPSTVLPVDDAAAGFDNIASALQVSPSFMEQYVNSARTLSAKAVGDPAPRPVGVPYHFKSTPEQEFHVPGLPLGTRGGVLIEHLFPADGDYELNIGDLVTGLWVFNQEHVNTLIALIDGKEFYRLDIGGGEDLKELDQIGAPAVDKINARLKKLSFTTTAGVHKIGVTFLERSLAESDRQLQVQAPGGGQDAVLMINSVEIFGPLRATGLSQTASREKIFSCYPEQPSDARPCAARIVAKLAERAFRGFSTPADAERIMQLYDQGAKNGGFEEGVKYALSGVLVHPKFLYRFEPLPDSGPPGGTFALTSTEIASRLSFFLWSTIPDAELLEVAATDGLKDPAVLEREVRRMLADPRATTLASNFAFQWLGLGKLAALPPDPAIFADVDPDIRDYMVEEIDRFVDSVFREDRSVLDLLTADHTFLNEALALHYGMNDIRGERFRRVKLTDARRFGLLGKGAVLLASSYPNRTAPVLRGAWVLDRLLGTPPPDPPPNVEALVENVAGKPALGVRERLEAHRTNPSCNGCHGVMDPLGFALENFDAVGRWRDMDRESHTPIDASGVLTDGTAVTGPIELRRAILSRPEQFVQTLVERLMTYGLGRSLDYQDMPTVRRIVRQAAAENYRFSSIVLRIIATEQFQSKAVPSPNPELLSQRSADRPSE